jgi:hypothetical protein
LYRAVDAELTVYGNIDLANIKSLEITFEFNALNLEIKSAYANSSFIMKCPTPITNYNKDDLTKSTVTIFCNDIQNINNGIICKLIVEALAGPDSITYLTPKSIKINDSLIDDANLTRGIIKIHGENVTQQYPEGIGRNYPNPFNEITTFPLSINYKTKVAFKIYANDGRFILSNDEANDMMELSFFDNKRNEIPITDLNSDLNRGNYILRLKPDYMQFASGMYYLIMIIDNKVYHRNFIYFK